MDDLGIEARGLLAQRARPLFGDRARYVLEALRGHVRPLSAHGLAGRKLGMAMTRGTAQAEFRAAVQRVAVS